MPAGQAWHPAQVGMLIKVTTKSDSGTDGDLDKVWDSEVVSASMNPFGSYIGITIPMLVSSWQRPTAIGRTDLHSQTKAYALEICDFGGGGGGNEVRQAFKFYCERCGMTHCDAVAIPNSGYQIKYSLIKGVGTRVDLKVDKNRMAVTVDDIATQAGSATANYSKTDNARQ
jgi:hypothetical protein